MKICERDLYHGAALTKIVMHESFKALNKATEKYGHYQVNHNARLLTKHSTKTKKGLTHSWQFTFNPDDITVLKADIVTPGISSYVVLTCGQSAVCCITSEEIQKLIDMSESRAQGVSVTAEPGKQLRVGSGRVTRELLVPMNRFPKCVFETP